MNDQRSLFSIENLLIIYNKSCYIDWHINNYELLSVNSCVNGINYKNYTLQLYSTNVKFTNQQFYNTNENETTLRW